MNLLEIVAAKSDVLTTAFAIQREELDANSDLVTVDLSGVSSSKARKPVFEAISDARSMPDAVLLRGIGLLAELHPYLPKKVPLFVDHCTPAELGKTSPLGWPLRRATRVYCYSQDVDASIRQLGTGKITVIAGPFLPTLMDPTPNKKPVIGVLNSCSGAIHVLGRVLKIAKAQGWEFDLVTTLRHSKATIVDNDFEVVEAADLVLAPGEDMDFGAPHEPAILALAMRKTLIGTRSEAFNVMGFPKANFISAQKYNLGSYAAAVGTYLRKRDTYSQWGEGESTPDPLALPRDLLSRIP